MVVGIRVEEIMHKGIITVDKSASVTEAARVMARAGVGGLIVTDINGPVGIITEGDIIRRVLAEGKDPKKTRVEEVMSAPLKTVGRKTDLETVAEKMRDYNVDRLPVTGEDGRIIGIITERDLVRTEPDLILITREKRVLESIRGQRPAELRYSGVCESCGNYSEDLMLTPEGLLCPECRGE